MLERKEPDMYVVKRERRSQTRGKILSIYLGINPVKAEGIAKRQYQNPAERVEVKRYN